MSKNCAGDPRCYTDIHVHVAELRDAKVDVDTSLLFPGAVNATHEHAAMLEQLAKLCEGKRKADFTISYGTGEATVFFRVRRDDFPVDGTWLRMRRMADKAPDFGSLKFPLPEAVQFLLLDGALQSGGLIAIVGPTGAGKTTTAGATVVERLKMHGGLAYTVEDPPELPLNGRHGHGYCTQTEVAGETVGDWVESMRGVLRSQPAGTPVILYVGEIRDPQAAHMVLRAALNGFLVICTAFGNDVLTGIQSLIQLFGEEQRHQLAQMLRLVVHQQFMPDRLLVEFLCSEGPNSRVAAILRNGTINSLRDEITLQRNRLLQPRAPVHLVA
ncbi:MAG: ATPase, T2SS/T4P/T4SS family [Vicinamibacterales bacterium]